MTRASQPDELNDLAERVATLLDGRRLATAESCSAGGLALTLSEAEGASDWLLGGVVAYHRDVKYDVLDVARGPVVNHETAHSMARGVVRLLGADVAVGITGATGPAGLDGAPPGTVFIGFSIDGVEDTVEHHFEGSREEVTTAAIRGALEGLVERLGGDDQSDRSALGASTPGDSTGGDPTSSSSRSTSSSPT